MSAAVERLGAITERIRLAAEGSRRDPSGITLIAVSKTFDADAIAPVLELGHRDFGENRVQEAQRKWPALRDGFPGTRLHLIGALQTNKVRDAVALFDAIHSVDRDKLAGEIANEIGRQSRPITAFVQVNTGSEPQKAGVVPGEAAAFVRRCREAHGLPVAGLMCIPPAGEDPARHFDLLREIGRELEVPDLSMGMSSDFEIAIGQGATHLRVGSAIFGERG